MRFWYARPAAPAGLRRDLLRQAGLSMLQYGVEMRVPDTIKKPDELFTSGTPDVFGDRGRPRRPPAGRQVDHRRRRVAVRADQRRSAGGSRCALLGTLSILMVGRAARRLFGSTLLGTIAALLLAVRGPPLRPVAHRPARPHRHVLGAGGVLRACSSTATAPASCSPSGSAALRRGSSPGCSGRGSGAPVALGGAALPGPVRGHQVVGAVLPRGVRLMTVLWDIGARRAAGVRRWLLGRSCSRTACRPPP